MAICPIICSFYDVACEFACAVGCAETISANVLNIHCCGICFMQSPVVCFKLSSKVVPNFSLEKCYERKTQKK